MWRKTNYEANPLWISVIAVLLPKADPLRQIHSNHAESFAKLDWAYCACWLLGWIQYYWDLRHIKTEPPIFSANLIRLHLIQRSRNWLIEFQMIEIESWTHRLKPLPSSSGMALLSKCFKLNKGARSAFVLSSSCNWTIAYWISLQKNQAGMGWRKFGCHSTSHT